MNQAVAVEQMRVGIATALQPPWPIAKECTVEVGWDLALYVGDLVGLFLDVVCVS